MFSCNLLLLSFEEINKKNLKSVFIKMMALNLSGFTTTIEFDLNHLIAKLDLVAYA